MLSRVDVRAKLLCDRVQPHQHLDDKTMAVIFRVKYLGEEEEYDDDDDDDEGRMMMMMTCEYREKP